MRNPIKIPGTNPNAEALKRWYGREIAKRANPTILGQLEPPKRHLAELYLFFKSNSADEKIAVLKQQLGGTFNFYTDKGEPTKEQILACLEAEYLERMGLQP